MCSNQKLLTRMRTNIPPAKTWLCNECLYIDNNIVDNNNSQCSVPRSNTSLTTGLRYSPDLVLTVTTLTNSSGPRCTATTRAIGQVFGIKLSSHKSTMSPTAMFLVGRCHFEKRRRLTRYSADHRCQKWRTKAWHKCQRLRRLRFWNDWEGLDSASKGLPMRKWPGVRASNSLSVLTETIGRLLRHDSIWVSTVEISRKWA